jgi:hypothetical protein
MTEIFNESITAINGFYKQMNYKLGWRFLNGSKKILTLNPEIALITLNPGGNEIPEDHPWESCEKGSSYLYESWGNSAPGKHNLQKQIQLMFAQIIKSANLSISTAALIEQSITGYFVPFRSPRLDDLKHKKEAFEFADNLWGKILQHIKPKLFICIDKDTHKKLKPLLGNIYNLPITNTKKFSTGWGNTTAELDSFGNGPQLQILRLPHLSTFKLFSSQKCINELNIIFDDACTILRKELNDHRLKSVG